MNLRFSLLREKGVQAEKNPDRCDRYRHTAVGKEKQTKQKRRYLPIICHIDSVLESIMDENESVSLPELSERIYESRHVRMKPSTIEHLLKQYTEKYGKAPLNKIDEKNYKLNGPFFEGYERKRTNDKII
jgi:hypothetical protein